MNLPVIGLAGEVLMNEAILIQKYYFLMLKMQSHTPSLRIEQTYALAVGIDHRLWLQLQLLARKWDCHLRVAFLFSTFKAQRQIPLLHPKGEANWGQIVPVSERNACDTRICHSPLNGYTHFSFM